MGRDTVNVVASRQSAIDKLPYVLTIEAVCKGSPNEGKTLNMLSLKSCGLRATTSGRRWRPQAIFHVKPHLFDTHAHVSSNLGKSEWPRSHLHISHKT